MLHEYWFYDVIVRRTNKQQLALASSNSYSLISFKIDLMYDKGMNFSEA